jgi:hypothetical protein
MLRNLAIALTVVLIAGCQAGFSANHAYLVPSSGSIVKLHKQLVVPAGHTRVFLQHGQVVAKAKFDRYYPSCNFEVWKLTKEPTVIHPGEFIVTKATQDINHVVSLEYQKVAALRWHNQESDRAMIMHAMHMRLQSAKQPNLYRLTCRGWLADPSDAVKPTITDMREALGNFASIKLIGE